MSDVPTRDRSGTTDVEAVRASNLEARQLQRQVTALEKQLTQSERDKGALKTELQKLAGDKAALQLELVEKDRGGATGEHSKTKTSVTTCAELKDAQVLSGISLLAAAVARWRWGLVGYIFHAWFLAKWRRQIADELYDEMAAKVCAIFNIKYHVKY